MQFEVSPIDATTSRVLLTGRMDSAGVDQIELRFTAAVVAAGRQVVVDMSGVEFLASMGIRLFISTARALQNKGLKIALYGASEAVQSVLDTVALDQIMPVTSSESQALEELKA
jgi:anti-anti-sigma factor